VALPTFAVASAAPRRAPRILVLDVGGAHVKAHASHRPGEVRIPSGPTMTPEQMLRGVQQRLKGWRFDVVSIGYPGWVVRGKIRKDPQNLGPGWVDFDFERAFGRPTRIVNDAAMQAIGSYEGGRMLFLGLGTGLGSAMIVEGKLAPMELAHLPYKKGKTYEEYVGEAALLRLGRKKWRKEVGQVVEVLTAALGPDYVVLGGGNSRRLRKLAKGVRRGDNANAFIGGLRLWRQEWWPEEPGRRAVGAASRPSS
jgi:predicted NBD/HSP70 family sugar kinase